MDITISVHRDELTRAIRDFLPMRLTLGKLEANDDPAWVQIDELETVTFLPGHGVGVTCGARVHYPLPILPDDFTVQHVSLEMVPAIVPGPGGAVLAFTLDVDELAIEYLPDFIDRVVADKINTALRANATTIAWDFTKSLRRMVDLPKRLELVRALEVGLPLGDVAVTDDAFVVTLSVDVRFHHQAEDPGEPCPQP